MANILIQRGGEQAIAINDADFERYYRGQGYMRMGPAPAGYPVTPSPSGAPSSPSSAATQAVQPNLPPGYSRIDGIQTAQDYDRLINGGEYEDVRSVGNPDQGGYLIGYRIPTATVIGPSGERVRVRTDNRTGTYRTQAEMLAQGFQVERSPGVAQNGSTPGGAASNLGSRPNLNYSGQIISGQDPNYDAYLQAGARPVTQQGGSGTTGTGQAGGGPAAPSVGQAGANGYTAPTPGVDMSGWTQSMQDAYQQLVQHTERLAAQGMVVNPNVQIDDATVQRFLQQARDESAPYYRQVFDQANRDLRTAFGQISADYAAKVRDIGTGYGRALESTQEDFARRGLEFSSDRDRAEASLATEAANQLSDAERAAKEAGERAGTLTERAVGSANLTPERGSIFGGAAPITGRAGVYGLTQPNAARDLFAAQGSTFGEQERAQLFDVETRRRDLTNAEQQLRAGYTM